jgi:hypothetical protein
MLPDSRLAENHRFCQCRSPTFISAVFFHFCSSLVSLWLQKGMPLHLKLATEKEVIVICF